MSREMETVEPFTFNHPQHQNASSEQLMGSNYGSIVAGQPEVQHAHRQASGLFSCINAPAFTSFPPQHQEATHQDQGVFSREMETVDPFTFDVPQHQNASSEQIMGYNYGSIVAGQSETLHVHQKGSGEISGLYAQPFTSDLPRHQEAYTGQPRGSNFWPMPTGQSEAQHSHRQASGQLSGTNAPLFTTYTPQHQEATHQDQGFMTSETYGKKISLQSLLLDDSLDVETLDRLTLDLLQHQNASSEQFLSSNYGWQSQALHVHQQSPGQFNGLNAAFVFAGNSESMHYHTQNASLHQHHQAAVVSEKSLFQALPCKQNYGCSATPKEDFIPQLYPYTTYGSMTSPFLGQNLEHANQENEIQHRQHVTVHESQMTDRSHGIGTNGLQVALIPWQYRESSEQQQNVSTTEDFGILDSQVLPSTGHAKDKGKALATEELPAGGKTKAAGAAVEEANQSRLNKTYCSVHSSEQLCRDSQFSCRPASFDLKMSESRQRKCMNVISQIEKWIKENGDLKVPLIADVWKRDDNSAYKINFAGLCTVDFRSITQRLKENVFETLHDFIKDVQSMLKGVADQFQISCEMVKEAKTIHNLFFEYLERAFKNTNFSREKKEVEFTSTVKKPLLSKNRGRQKNKQN